MSNPRFALPNRRPIGLAPIGVLAAVVLMLGGCAGMGLVPGAGAPPRMAEHTAGAVPAGDSDYERGKREIGAGRLGLAVLHFRAALDQAPDSVEAWNGLGAAFDRLGRFDLSARAYGRALAIDPHAAQTLNNLGYSFLLQGRYELAAAYLRDVAARPEADARTLENRRLAEEALARAGGPAPRRAGASRTFGYEPEGTAFKPRLLRIGKASQRLVTKAPRMAGPDRASAWPSPGPRRASIQPRDLLPAFLAAPMTLDGAPAGAPALGAARLGPMPPRADGL